MHQAVRERPEEDERQRLREDAREDERQRVRVEVHLDVHLELDDPDRHGREHVRGREEREAHEPREPEDAGHAAGDDAHRRVDKVDRLLVGLHVLHGEELHVLALQLVHACSLVLHVVLDDDPVGNSPLGVVATTMLFQRRLHQQQSESC